ncbi:Hypothetical protein POVN_LOCUS676 [uncultured virus]|nr:Hypothetical protein POVN_LOCUS676 [uncultured virus]
MSGLGLGSEVDPETAQLHLAYQEVVDEQRTVQHSLEFTIAKKAVTEARLAELGQEEAPEEKGTTEELKEQIAATEAQLAELHRLFIVAERRATTEEQAQRDNEAYAIILRDHTLELANFLQKGQGTLEQKAAQRRALIAQLDDLSDQINEQGHLLNQSYDLLQQRVAVNVARLADLETKRAEMIQMLDEARLVYSHKQLLMVQAVRHQTQQQAFASADEYFAAVDRAGDGPLTFTSHSLRMYERTLQTLETAIGAAKQEEESLAKRLIQNTEKIQAVISRQKELDAGLRAARELQEVLELVAEARARSDEKAAADLAKVKLNDIYEKALALIDLLPSYVVETETRNYYVSEMANVQKVLETLQQHYARRTTRSTERANLEKLLVGSNLGIKLMQERLFTLESNMSSLRAVISGADTDVSFA